MDFEDLVRHVHGLLNDDSAWLPSVSDERMSYHYAVNHVLTLFISQEFSIDGFIFQMKINPHHFQDVQQRQWHKKFLLSVVDYHQYDNQMMCSIDEDGHHCISMVMSFRDEFSIADALQLLIDYSNKRSNPVGENKSKEKEGERNWIAI